MVRKQIYITAEQDAALKATASELDVTEAELVRQGIDAVLTRPRPKQADQEAALKEVLQERAKPAPPRTRTLSDELPWSRSDLYRDRPRRLDDAAWEEELVFMEKRARSLPEGGAVREWRREDSYDNRRLRLPD